jgi:bacteriocin biosynthesis cyclodehydratase domain-containing protein
VTSAAAVPDRIGFKRHLRVEVAAEDRALVFSERGVTVLDGHRVGALAPLLDGSRDLKSIVETVAAGVPGGAGEAAAQLLRLCDIGLVALRPAVPADAVTGAYWDAAGVAPPASAPVRVLAIDPVAGVAGQVVAALSALGFEAAVGPDLGPRDSAPELLLVPCADYLDERLAEVDAECRRRGIAWLPVKPVGTTLWVGPVFEPTVPGCLRCLTTRLAAHRAAETSALAELGRHGQAEVPPCALPATVSTAVHLAALEAGKWLAGHRHDGQRAVLTLDSLTLRADHHPLHVHPQCPACGDPGIVRARTRRPVELSARPVADTGTGGSRVLPPEELKARYFRHVSPITGVVKRIERGTRGPAFLNCYRAGANIAVRASGVEQMRSVLRAENGGKGVTPLDAEVSAFAEAVERYSATFHGDEERISGTLRALGPRALHPNTCQLFGRAQFERREQWNSAHSPFQRVPRPVDADTVLDWTPVWSLTDDEHLLLPTALLYFGAPDPGGHLIADSNGNAAGGTLEDAVLQGLLELVERDAVAVWWYNRTRAPGVDLGAFGDPWTDELVRVHAAMRRQVWVLDVTSDLGVPVLAAVSRRIDGPREEIVFGFGAHLDVRTALRRALTELNQMLPAVLPDPGGAPVDWSDDPDADTWWRTAMLADQPYLRPSADRPRTPADHPARTTGDLLGDITLIRGRLQRLGMRVLVLDQTRPDIGLPVVKVVVPGLRHFWSRFAPGRLFDVPVRLGRLARPTPEAELNPYPMFL